MRPVCESESLTSNGCTGTIQRSSLRGLTKRYTDGTLALEDFDLEIPAGAFFGLLGPNGAGKTTLISAVCNLSASPPARCSCSASRTTRSRRARGSASPSRTSTSTAS